MTYDNLLSIKQTIDDFDFEKVRKVMELLDWKWIDAKHPDEPAAIPTIEMLKDFATNLMVSAYVGKGTYSSGGFCANWYGSGAVLQFIVEEC